MQLFLAGGIYIYMKIRFNKITKTKNDNIAGRLTLLLDGGYQINFLYFDDTQSIRWTKGVKVNTGISKKLAFIIHEWGIYKDPNVIEPGEILNFSDTNFPYIEKEAARDYREWQIEREKQKNEKLETHNSIDIS